MIVGEGANSLLTWLLGAWKKQWPMPKKQDHGVDGGERDQKAREIGHVGTDTRCDQKTLQMILLHVGP